MGNHAQWPSRHFLAAALCVLALGAVVLVSTLFASDSVAEDGITPSQRVLAEFHDANRRRLPGNGMFKSNKDDGIPTTIAKNVFYYPLAWFIYGVEGTLSAVKNGFQSAVLVERKPKKDDNDSD